ncbi:MAG TPA: ABC transporter substrate-binding protein [Burkholderiaceae bacterium]|nr:ABC transporter substrate-binding protein [Burkholderiaceae bacterium]
MNATVRTLRRGLAAAALSLAAAGLAVLPVRAADKVLRYAFEIAETGFDPAQVSDLYSRNITANLFDAPLRYAWLAPPGTLEPATAASLPEVADDFRSFTFTLRPGIYFADDPAFHGARRELVAADYVYSIKRIADPRWKSSTWGQFEEVHVVGLNAAHDEAVRTGHFDYDRAIPGLQVLDRYRFRVVLEHPAPRFPHILADPSVCGAVAREVVERYGDAIMEHPVGTGPYRLADWRRSSRIVLERNPGYRDETFPVAQPGADDDQQALARQFAGRRVPMLDRVEISPIEESQPRWLAFINGEYDFMERMPRDLTQLALQGAQPTPLLQRLKIQLIRRPEIDVTLVVYNMQDPIVGGYAPAQVALRRALNLGINVDEMIRSIYKYQAFPAQTLVQPGTYGYDAQLRTENGDYDPARANALLDLYGYRRGADGWRTRPDGTPLAIEMNTEPDQRSRLTDEIFKKSFDALGVRILFKPAKWPENLKMVENGQFQAWILGWSASDPDSAGSLRLSYGPAIGGDNMCRMQLADYDRDFQRAATLPDGPERLALVRRLQEYQVAYAPMKALTHRFKIDLAYPWVQGYRKQPFIRDWWRYVDIDPAQRPRPPS